jgi:hypothetical protein
VLLGVILSRAPSRSPQEAVAGPVTRSPAELLITLEQLEYSHGAMKTVGVVKNVGEHPATNPVLQLEVWSADGKMLLGKTTTAPVGYMGKPMGPEAAAAFSLYTSIPGNRGEVRWKLSANMLHTITDKTKR